MTGKSVVATFFRALPKFSQALLSDLNDLFRFSRNFASWVLWKSRNLSRSCLGNFWISAYISASLFQNVRISSQHQAGCSVGLWKLLSESYTSWTTTVYDGWVCRSSYWSHSIPPNLLKSLSKSSKHESTLGSPVRFPNHFQNFGSHMEILESVDATT